MEVSDRIISNVLTLWHAQSRKDHWQIEFGFGKHKPFASGFPEDQGSKKPQINSQAEL